MRSDTMRAAVVPEPGAGYELVDRPVPEPGPGEVRIAVDACGVCRGDDVVLDGAPAVEYPRIAGHEVVGTVDALGANVDARSVGDRVGLGWHGGHCHACDECRAGRFVHCTDQAVTGLHRHGGYAEYTLGRSEALVDVPDALDDEDAAPLLCAGLTCFNAVRHADARPGDLAAVVGVGGLGHLAVQYAHAAGFETVAVSRGTAKRDAALALGADHYLDAESTDVATALQDLGGADYILTTAPASGPIAEAVEGLGPEGELCAVGAPSEDVPVDVGHLLENRASVAGWASGTPADAEDALAFGARRDVAPVTETYDLADLEAATERLLESDVRFRAVVTP
jgi:D-arabinose 1-dehydrogenase-like Zn-dependent alcohol dehydrogenase